MKATNESINEPPTNIMRNQCAPDTIRNGQVIAAMNAGILGAKETQPFCLRVAPTGNLIQTAANLKFPL